jgi:hypothetical protein
MLSVRRRDPVDYSKCNQTITIYHMGEDRTVDRSVFTRAFLDVRKNQTINKTGSTQANSFLLVIPCEACPVSVGDKVLLGTGPERVDWPSFIPSKVENLVVVKYVDPKYWQGRMVHVEAGG